MGSYETKIMLGNNRNDILGKLVTVSKFSIDVHFQCTVAKRPSNLIGCMLGNLIDGGFVIPLSYYYYYF